MFWDAVLAIITCYCIFIYLLSIGLCLGDDHGIKPNMDWALFLMMPLLLPIILGFMLAPTIEETESKTENQHHDIKRTDNI